MLRWGVSVACVALVAAGAGALHAAHAAGAHDALIAKHSAANGVPPSLVRRVIHIESRGNPKIVSKGNYGLMQIRLGTARAMGYTGPPEGLLDADTNMTYAVKYLGGAYRAANGNQERAIAYYQRGYTVSAKVMRFTPPALPFMTPPLEPRQILHTDPQPHHPPVPLPGDTAPIPVKPVTTEVIRKPKPSAAEVALQQARIAAAPADPTPVALASPMPRSTRAAARAERAPAPSATVAEPAPAATSAPQPARVAAAPSAERAPAPPVVAAPAPQPPPVAAAPQPQQPVAVASAETAAAPPTTVAVPLPPVRPAIRDTVASAPPAPAAQAAVTPSPSQPVAAAPAPQQPAAVASAEPVRAATPPATVNVPLPPVRTASRDVATSAPAPQTTATVRPAFAAEPPSYIPPERIVASRFSPVIESQSAMTVQPVSAQQRSALATQLAARAPLIQPLAPPPPAAAPAQVATAPQVAAPQVAAPQVTAPPAPAVATPSAGATPKAGAPQPAAAAAEPAPRTIQLAARPEPQAVPQSAEDKQAEPQNDAHESKRHSRRYRRAQPSLLQSLGVTTQQTRRTRQSSQPTNLLSFLKKAITPDTRTRRRR